MCALSILIRACFHFYFILINEFEAKMLSSLKALPREFTCSIIDLSKGSCSVFEHNRYSNFSINFQNPSSSFEINNSSAIDYSSLGNDAESLILFCTNAGKCAGLNSRKDDLIKKEKKHDNREDTRGYFIA